MAVQLVVLVILGTVIFFLSRSGGLKVPHAIICVLFGLYLAGTSSMGPMIKGFTDAIARFIAGIKL